MEIPGHSFQMLLLLLAFNAVKQFKLEPNVKTHRNHLWYILRLQKKIGFTSNSSHKFSNEKFTSNIWTSTKSRLYQPSVPMSYSSLCLHDQSSWHKQRTEMSSKTNLQKHFFVLGIIRIIGFSAQFFHICNKVSVPNDLQKASLKRDSQPKVFRRRNTHEEKQNIYFGICSLDICTKGLFIFI